MSHKMDLAKDNQSTAAAEADRAVGDVETHVENRKQGSGTEPPRGVSGPRTAQGKVRSSRNALKFGFFSKEVPIKTPFFKENKAEFDRLLKALEKDWRPVGAMEVLQVELVAAHLWQYRRRLQVQQALIVADNLPRARNVSFLVDLELDALKAERGIKTEPKAKLGLGSSLLDNPDDDLLEEACERAGAKYRKDFEEFEQLEDEQRRVAKLKKTLPHPSGLEWLQKCEAHILRHYYRALAELERLQRMRLGDKVPPRLVVELNQS